MKPKLPKRGDRAVQDAVWIQLPDALDIANDTPGFSISRSGFVKWVNRYDGLGKKIGGRWSINREALSRMLNGEQLPEKQEVANG